ncbi:MAG: hypothetical protein H6739_10440 [Alphaproteobacteria bacterium]|nr:hypothetical protein [Alphaproteobacteria bacterium]
MTAPPADDDLLNRCLESMLREASPDREPEERQTTGPPLPPGAWREHLHPDGLHALREIRDDPQLHALLDSTRDPNVRRTAMIVLARVVMIGEPVAAFAHQLGGMRPGEPDLTAPQAQEALAWIEDLERMLPGHLLTRWARCMVCRAHRDHSEALDILEGLARDFPDHEEILGALASLCLEAGEPEAVVELHEELERRGRRSRAVDHAAALALVQLLTEEAVKAGAVDPGAPLAARIDHAIALARRVHDEADPEDRESTAALLAGLRRLEPLGASLGAALRDAWAPPDPVPGEALPVNGPPRYAIRFGALERCTLPDWPYSEHLSNPVFLAGWIRRDALLAQVGDGLRALLVRSPWPIRSWTMGSVWLRDDETVLEMFLFATPQPREQPDCVAKLSVRYDDPASGVPKAATLNALLPRELLPQHTEAFPAAERWLAQAADPAAPPPPTVGHPKGAGWRRPLWIGAGLVAAVGLMAWLVLH